MDETTYTGYLQKQKMLVGQKIAILNGEKVLLLRRSRNSSRPGGWDLPGGGLEVGEDPYQGIKREIAEETRLTVTGLRPIHALSYFEDKENFVLSIGYIGHVVTERVILSDVEHDKYVWVKKNEIKNYELHGNYLAIIEKAYEQQ